MFVQISYFGYVFSKEQPLKALCFLLCPGRAGTEPGYLLHGMLNPKP